MKKLFTYSILQYKHSNLIREAVNVGILFIFYEESRIEFVVGNGSRVKALYPNFDISIFNATLKYINNTIKTERTSLFGDINFKENIKQFINTKLLSEDASVLQFTETYNSISLADTQKTVQDYTKLLLPGVEDEKKEKERHNENFLLKQYLGFLSEKLKGYSKHVERNKIIQWDNVTLKFDLAWQNGTTNLVKPLAFDLKEEQDIQSKSITYFGYLTKLSDYAIKNECRFDLIVSRPSQKKLYGEYEKALKIIEDSIAPKRIIEESQLKKYSEETIEEILKHD